MTKLIRIACVLSMASCDAPHERLAEDQQPVFAIGEGGAGASEATASVGTGVEGGAGGVAGGGTDAEGGAACDAEGAAGGGTGGGTGAQCGGGPPKELVLQCGKSQAATAMDKRDLEVLTSGYTEAQARAKCEAAEWKSQYLRCKASNCQELQTKVEEFDSNLVASPACTQYFGPDVEQTQPCECKRIGVDLYSCSKRGVIPVGDKFECLGCYAHYVWLGCGLVSKIPPGASRKVAANIRGASEAEARGKCDTTEYKATDLICNGLHDIPSYPSFPATSVEQKTVVHCRAPSNPGGTWDCRCEGFAKATADFDCRHCPPRHNPPGKP